MGWGEGEGVGGCHFGGLAAAVGFCVWFGWVGSVLEGLGWRADMD